MKKSTNYDRAAYGKYLTEADKITVLLDELVSFDPCPEDVSSADAENLKIAREALEKVAKIGCLKTFYANALDYPLPCED